VYEAVRQLPVQRILLKSTVPPGTTEDLVAATGKQVCFSPVYVGEHSWNEPSSVTDSVEVPFAVLGGEPAIRHYFVDVLLTSLGPTTKFLQCTAREAELTKYMENLFHATKAAFVNEFRQVAEAFGADWYTVREGWLLDPRVGPAFTAVPDQERGFGGTCLPKDLDALIAACATVGYRPELLEEVRRSNVRFRDPRTG
jgi:nucleotide sugar dehydrogenase